MPQDVYFINEDEDCCYAESLVRMHKKRGETEYETAQRVLDEKLLKIWIDWKEEEKRLYRTYLEETSKS